VTHRQVGDGFAVGLAITLAEPADRDGQIAVLRGRVGKRVHASIVGIAPAAEVGGSRRIDVIERHDHHRQRASSAVARPQHVDLLPDVRLEFQLDELSGEIPL
jgi:hypothetical protein